MTEIGVHNLPLYSDATMGVFNDLKKRGLAIGLPTTLLVDGKGCRIGIVEGPAEWDSADAKALIQAAFAYGGIGLGDLQRFRGLVLGRHFVLLGDLDAIAALQLGSVERQIGGLDERVERGAGLGLGDAGADGGLDHAVVQRRAGIGEGDTDALGGDVGRRRRWRRAGWRRTPRRRGGR